MAFHHETFTRLLEKKGVSVTQGVPSNTSRLARRYGRRGDRAIHRSSTTAKSSSWRLRNRIAACSLWSAALGFLLIATPLSAQSTNVLPDNYFYRGYPYGSGAAFHPVSELINGTFGLLQIRSNWVTLDEVNWAQGLEVTWESITHPLRTVDAYGREEFLTSEVFPAKLSWSGLQYVPNYSLHMIGGGARHRAFMEWYEAHGFAFPTLWAWGTTTLHAFGVEAFGHHSETRPTVDPVADMLIFDPLGALLFSSDRVAGFFANTLNMSIWSGQPMYNPILNSVENAGQNYGLHYFFSKNHRVGIFSYWGMSHLFGITVRGGKSFDWSVGVGGAVDELEEQDRGELSAFSARLKFDAGLFLHRHGSLLVSMHVSQAWTQLLRVNVYPGWLSPGGRRMGVYTGVRGDNVIVGLTFTGIPVGLSLSQ